MPLVLQYVREHQDTKIREVTRRVDLVEGPRMQAHLHDAERQGGRDRRKEMWRIGTAMETAALLLTRPKGRSVPMTGEAAKRANEYLQARPGEDVLLPPEPVASLGSATSPAPGTLAGRHPPWLHKPPEIALPPSGPVAVPISTSDDPSALPPGTNPAPAPRATGPPPPPPPPSNAELEHRLTGEIDRRFAELAKSRPPEGADTKALLASAMLDLEAKWTALVEARMHETADKAARAMLAVQTDLASRIAAIESRPVVSPSDVATQAEQKVLDATDSKFKEISEKVDASVRSSGEMWASRLREELHQSVDELKAQASHDEEEMRAALVAQIDLELREAQEQGTVLREEIEGRVRSLLQDRLAEMDQRKAKELRELEQRLGLLVDGRTKDVEARLQAANAEAREKLAAAQDDRVAQAIKRWSVDGEARLAETNDAQTQAMAGLQVRLQSYFEQKLRENQEREREKYVELLARLKSEVEQSLAKTIDSSKFDAVIHERVARGLEAGRGQYDKLIQQSVTAAELRLASKQEEGVVRLERLEAKIQQRETDLLRVEGTVRKEIEDLDRRIQVVADRALPLIRRTWLRVSELEKAGPAGTETEAHVKELRREMARELRRIEGELLEQTGDLRDRLEATLASQGRIWLNLLKQLETASASLVRAESAARGGRRGLKENEDASLEELMDANLRDASGYPAFESDPPNPLDPRAPPASVAAEERETRRRARRT